MGRRIAFALALASAMTIILAVSLAKVGIELDDARLERSDLQFEVSDLKQQVHALDSQRELLQGRVVDQSKAIEQLKNEVDRLRVRAQKQQQQTQTLANSVVFSPSGETASPQ